MSRTGLRKAVLTVVLLSSLFLGMSRAAYADNTVTVVSSNCGCFTTSPSLPFTIAKNASQDVTFTPGSGFTYSSSSLSPDGSTGAYSGGFNVNPKNGTDGTSYTATVDCTGGKLVTVNQVADGTIASSGNCGTDYWKPNTTATYIITPAAGYVVTSYTIDSTTTYPTTKYDNANPLTVSFAVGTTAHTITANYSNTRTVTVVQSGTVTGTVTSCNTGATNTWGATASASYSITPTVSSSGASLISSITVSPTSPQTGSSQTITVTNGGTGSTCSNPITFPMNELNQTLTVNYTVSDAVSKTVNTNGSASSTGGSITSCGNYSSDNWASTATASYSITPNSGYVLSTLSLSPATPYASPAGSIQAAGYACGNYTFPIGGQTQSLTANFVSAVSVTGSIQESSLASNVNLTCNNSTGVCTATDKVSGATVGTLTSCNGSNSWGQNLLATYMVTPGSGFKLTSISAAGTTNSSPPAGGYATCASGYSFNAGTGATLSANFVPSAYAAIYGTVVDSTGVSDGDIKVGGASIVSGSFSPYNGTQNASVTASFTIPSGAGIKNLYWTPSGGILVDVTAMLTCASLSPADFTSATCQFTIPATTGTTPGGTAFNGVGTTGGTLKVVYDQAYTFTVTATTTGCGGSNGGLVNGAASKTYNVVNGATVTVTGAAAAGYAIKDIQYNGASLGIPASQLGTSYSYVFGPITAAGNTGAFVFTPVFTVNSGPPVSTPAGSTATGTIAPASQQVLCGSAIQPITITPTPPATLQDVKIVAPDGTTTDLGALSTLTSAVTSLGNVQKSWTITATFYQAPINTASYSIVPPFITSSVLPNLLLMIDNSGSQYDLQYDSTGQCYDNNAYVNAPTSNPYAGYFNSSAFYSYNAANNNFVSGATLPSSCTYLTPYFCVNMSGTKPNRTVSNFVASGNFLNYLATSKLDIQKLILTGGKYDTVNGNLVAESRGCGGKRFVKVISDLQRSAGSTETLNNLTFVIRGPNAGSGTNFNPAVQGGTTHIDIYDYSYANQIATCQTAFNDWATGANQGTTQGATDACISSSVTNPLYNNVLQLIHACYYTIVKGNSAPPAGQTNNVEKGCQSEYTGSPAIAPSSITNNQAGDAVCSSVISHAPIDGRDTGYVGLCWNGSSFDDTCVNNQILDFCGLMQQNQVTDPSSVNTTTTSYAAVMPGFFMDAGINSLGTAAASYLANVSATAPSGLISQFAGYINFGAATFNQDGAGSECVDVTSTTSLGPNQIPCARHCSNNSAQACYFNSDCGTGNSCVTNTKLDGGKVISYITTNGSVGNHSTGLINAIDNIQASSWTPWGEAFYDAIGYFANNTNYRLQAQDWDTTQPPPAETCRLNNILIITDGVPTADQNAAVNTLSQQYNDGTTNSFGSCGYYSGSKNIAALAWAAYHRNIHNLTQPADHSVNNQYISTYIAYSGPQAQSTDPCDPFNLMTLTAKDGNTGKIPLYWATTPSTMLNNLQTIFEQVATSSASGTGASILNNSQGSGANLLQAVFFPKKAFAYTDNNGNQQQDVASWIGELQNLWFYLDPYLGNSSVREDTNQDYQLSLTNDYVVSFGYSQNQATVTLAQDVNGNGTSLVTKKSNITLDGLNSLWKAGRSLWNRNLTTDPRNIYTVLATPDANGVVTSNGTSVALQKFSSVASDNFDTNSTAASYLQVTGANQAAITSNIDTLVNYISGTDQSIYRSRAVTIPNCGLTDSEGCKREWKLGDIVSSTPKMGSSVALNTYAAPLPNGYADTTYTTFTGSHNYQNRGMAFVGGNDGMLHAFRLGILDVSRSVTTSDIKAQMDWPTQGTRAQYPSSGSAGSDLGREEWAFIPMNALPYLGYLGDPNYTHLYYVDNTVSIVDMSINPPSGCSGNYYGCQKKTTLQADQSSLDLSNTSWRSVLIGGMGLGGATHDINNSCVNNVASGTCVKLPMTGNVGYSSYFALDVTNPHSLPGTAGGVKLLWEFNGNGQLGYSLSGPAIVRVGPKDQNGRWFAIFGSGPTGPIENTTHTFYGKSDQNLKLFVVDVGTGALVRTIDTGVPNAFAATITNGVIDVDRNYSDDAVYIGYSQADTSVTPNTWTKGGVLRLLTQQSNDPTTWTVNPLITSIGPVTASVTKLQDTNVRYGNTTGKLWLYFGTGRYFYKADTLTPSTPFQLYGVTDPCYSWHDSSLTPKGPTNAYASACTDQVDTSKLVNQSGNTPTATIDPAAPGWYLNLAMSETYKGSNYSAERVITNPNANGNGTVFFSTLLPSTDVCGVGGNTYIWALKYDSGGAPMTATLQGSILLQVSTGDLQQISLKDSFTPGGAGGAPAPTDGNRRLGDPISGVPPTGSGMLGMNRPAPSKKLLHIQEK